MLGYPVAVSRMCLENNRLSVSLQLILKWISFPSCCHVLGTLGDRLQP